MDPDQLHDCRILVVDDEPSNVSALLRLLGRSGYGFVHGITDPRQALREMEDFAPDLLLLDLRMPHMDGFQVLDAIRTLTPETEYFPVLVLTGDLSPEVREQALSAGARDFITKPFDLTEVLLRIKNLLETRALHLALRDTNRHLEDRVRERTRELASAQLEILARLARAAEYRDDLTGRHAQRVGLLSSLLMAELGRPEDEVQLVRWAATLHDVGKIGIPDAILLKPGPLTPEEYTLMKSHVQIGEKILSGSRFSLMRMAGEIARTHHERWDGNGYQALAGEDIPLPGRVVALADAYDSLTHSRPYKEAIASPDAVGLIAKDRGRHFDPAVVDAFLSLRDQGVLETLDARVRQGEGSESDPSVPLELAVSSP
ncbi:MAG: response regulator [Gemmatimonadales bacterium]|nr:MAG: response regulator [Gemmatimonadales bacterium]